VEDVPQDVEQDLGFPGGARPPRHATTAAALSLCRSR